MRSVFLFTVVGALLLVAVAIPVLALRIATQ